MWKITKTSVIVYIKLQVKYISHIADILVESDFRKWNDIFLIIF